PGDIALWQFGRCFSHAAIVSQWPRIIHAHTRAGVVIEENADSARWLMFVGNDRRAVKFLSLW
ncbi:MAG: hydrolase, partial [Rhodospirillales bacterium]|nr:hydrolase [Rhodospirillales bacterium]